MRLVSQAEALPTTSTPSDPSGGAIPLFLKQVNFDRERRHGGARQGGAPLLELLLGEELEQRLHVRQLTLNRLVPRQIWEREAVRDRERQPIVRGDVSALALGPDRVGRRGELLAQGVGVLARCERVGDRAE
jgi:hypothetical protein